MPGPHGFSGTKNNGLFVLRIHAEQRLILTNTCFRLPLQYKATRMHPQSRQWHLLDYAPSGGVTNRTYW
ncbi:unnamed protein product [Dibothriocephalus latus]|uniref:Uncharacterized protein n=1 Tax=Dibothriocephalus latus TaxID=60516 RepID=A0A3P7PQF6_DIBLA|nr:unnamed protein product [Dibothriocephalus latus]